MLRRFLNNHTLANLTFLLVLIMGAISYLDMPREQDPSINFNWVNINTTLPGASAESVEKQITDPLEEAIAKVADIKFVSSSSRQDISSILVRFEEIDDDTFRTRLADIRREVQNKLEELPADVERPEIAEINTGNAFPTALVLVTAVADDETLHKQARSVTEDLDRMSGVWRARALGEQDPELQVLFSPEKLVGVGITPTDLSDTVAAYFRDLAAGSVRIGDKKWQLHIEGTASDPQYLADLPIISGQGEIPLRSVADVVRGRTDPAELVRYQEQPGVLIYVAKKANANMLELVDRIKEYIEQRNALRDQTGIELVLLDDRTSIIREGLSVMQRNALYGLALVMLVTWVFLGAKIAFFTSIGLPFVLAGTFWFLATVGQTLNVVVLLGVVISLGMLVDDAIVVVEAIYYHLQRGRDAVDATVAALREVALPVATAVLTTIAAFLPLMLMPGILGKFMFVVPLVVTTALLISLVEAFWMLPAHVISARVDVRAPSRLHRFRQRATASLRVRYVRLLIKALRHRLGATLFVVVPFLLALGAVATGLVRTEFFASDPYRFFYVNVLMPPGTALEKTMQTTLDVERVVRANLDRSEVRSIASYAGRQFSEVEPFIGDRYGQVFVNLRAETSGQVSVDELIDRLRDKVVTIAGPEEVSFLRRTGGPPTTKPVSVKVRGDDPAELRRAADRLVGILSTIPAVTDIADDDTRGRMELSLRLNADTITRAGIDPVAVIRIVRLLGDGEVAASMQHQGEKVEVRVRAENREFHAIDSFLRNTVSLGRGSEIAIDHLLDSTTKQARANIRHYNLRRAITVEADLDKEQMDTIEVNRLIQREWAKHTASFPGVDLDFSGELDDIRESLNSIFVLFLFGIGLIYLILGTQFKSYLQPLYVLSSVPMAFTGVALGLFISGHPLSMYTLYGIVALAGIAVNDAIVLIATANNFLARGMSVRHAAVYAAKRRVVPVIITTLTTMAGLFSLAVGLGGKSLMWGPVATAIFWGLAFSTMLTLCMIPLLFASFTRVQSGEQERLPDPAPFPGAAWHPARLIRSLFATGKLVAANEQGLQELADDQTLSALYREGVDRLSDKRFDKAIRTFERMAGLSPDNAACNLYAAQALIMYMREHGWDVGYYARAQRYLARASRIAPDEQRLMVVQRAFEKLQPDTPAR